ncbi:tctex1 domain-containing protein 1-B-like [Acanthaster planci]|uniref:Tctex1 domain-containing protein 1-B-like n=1 Tax=Acanthaster planci TaxID=133434 RepID=A0A8B7XUP5_ACAPL|nr:tctex1 domain-containing protein 1-B-like [Acanthaster planci]
MSLTASKMEPNTGGLLALALQESSEDSRSSSPPAFEPSFRMDGPGHRKFRELEVGRLVEGILASHLADEIYDPVRCKQLSQDIAGKINQRVRELDFPRYKLVALVNIGSAREKPGTHLGSRCLWDDRTDSSTTASFTNGSLYAVAMVYGLYYA